MKKIILSTDFSENAHHAIRYGLELLKDQACEFYLVHAYQTVQNTGMLISIHDLLREESKTVLQQSLQRIEKEGFSSENIIPKAVEGQLTNVLNYVAKKYDADLIIMGTKGASGLKEIIMGSNTSKVIQNVKIPVLAIPENAPLKMPESVLLAMDQEGLADTSLLAPLNELLKGKEVQRLILSVEDDEHMTNDERKRFQLNVDQIMNGYKHSYHFLQDKVDIDLAINTFVGEKPVDMMAVFPKKHPFFERLFFKSVSRDLVLHTQIPLIAVKG